jgi:hypothetical protein
MRRSLSLRRARAYRESAAWERLPFSEQRAASLYGVSVLLSVNLRSRSSVLQGFELPVTCNSTEDRRRILFSFAADGQKRAEAPREEMLPALGYNLERA